MVLLFLSLPIILHFCLATQQSNELRIKIDSKFARRQATDLYKLYYRSVRQTPSILHARQASPTTVYFVNAATPAGSINTATVSIHRSPTEMCSVRCFNYYLVGYGQLRSRVWVVVRFWVMVTGRVNTTQNSNPQGSTTPTTLTQGPQIR